MRKTTTEWEAEFLFALWDNVTMKLLEKDPRNRGYLVYVIRSELDALIRNYNAK